VADKGSAALERAVQHFFGLALLDYRMPGMDGLEVYRRIQQLRPSVLGIFVTAFAAGNVMEEAKDMDVRAVLPKPVGFGQLLPLVEETVGSPV
jgi:CheY-like chemotaxis protein